MLAFQGQIFLNILDSLRYVPPAAKRHPKAFFFYFSRTYDLECYEKEVHVSHSINTFFFFQNECGNVF